MGDFLGGNSPGGSCKAGVRNFLGGIFLFFIYTSYLLCFGLVYNVWSQTLQSFAIQASTILSQYSGSLNGNRLYILVS